MNHPWIESHLNRFFISESRPQFSRIFFKIQRKSRTIYLNLAFQGRLHAHAGRRMNVTLLTFNRNFYLTQ